MDLRDRLSQLRSTNCRHASLAAPLQLAPATCWLEGTNANQPPVPGRAQPHETPQLASRHQDARSGRAAPFERAMGVGGVAQGEALADLNAERATAQGVEQA